MFRAEGAPAQIRPGSIYRLTDLEIASRLSFFLWSSIPDDTLIRLAADKKLREPAVLEQQVRRMLADPRADALANNFASQWLHLRNLRDWDPDPYAFPNADRNLMASMERETELFFMSIVRDDRQILELLTADYTFIDGRLARHTRSRTSSAIGSVVSRWPTSAVGFARPRQHPDRDVVSDPNLTGGARQMDSRQPPGRAAAAATA